jgi:hypothetical protein
MKFKIIDLLLVLFLIIIITYGFYALQLIKSDSGQCANNPLIYSINFYNEKLETDMTCTCSFSDSRYAPLIVSKEGINPIKELISESNKTYETIDWSKVIIKENEESK